jgi:uncharacterized protein (TIGR02145 family)
MRIKAKIIGNQIWMTRDITHLQLRDILRTHLDVQSVTMVHASTAEKWRDTYEPAYCITPTKNGMRKQFLFNQPVVEMSFQILNHIEDGWRIPTYQDWNTLFTHLDSSFRYEDYWPDTIPKSMRGNYGWPINGTNACGFNATPNAYRDNNSDFIETTQASWWTLDNHNRPMGMALYSEDIITNFGTTTQSGMAIRMVRDLSYPRPETNILYV